VVDRGSSVAIRFKTRKSSDSADGWVDQAEEHEYDLVVGCDGIKSEFREHVSRGKGYSCKWTAYTYFCNVQDAPGFDPDFDPHSFGPGTGTGIYHCKDGRTLALLCAPDTVTAEQIVDYTKAKNKMLLETNAVIRACVEQAPAASEMFPWHMEDYRCEKWHKGRLALCGDAACTILATTGHGTTMALKAAICLADELSRVDAERVPLALGLYEKRARKTVESQQNSARTLARAFFTSSPLKARAMLFLLGGAGGCFDANKLYNKDEVSFWKLCSKAF
jgi:2-polyprenyl-6-methoxyphenol hydroxylase-like FAD-dependent oxidoreductase